MPPSLLPCHPPPTTSAVGTTPRNIAPFFPKSLKSSHTNKPSLPFSPSSLSSIPLQSTATTSDLLPTIAAFAGNLDDLAPPPFVTPDPRTLSLLPILKPFSSVVPILLQNHRSPQPSTHHRDPSSQPGVPTTPTPLVVADPSPSPRPTVSKSLSSSLAPSPPQPMTLPLSFQSIVASDVLSDLACSISIERIKLSPTDPSSFNIELFPSSSSLSPPPTPSPPPMTYCHVPR